MTASLSARARWLVGIGSAIAFAALAFYLAAVSPHLEEYQSAGGQLAVGFSSMLGSHGLEDQLQALLAERTCCIVFGLVGIALVVVGLAMPRKTET
jgi:hypothetical protein